MELSSPGKCLNTVPYTNVLVMCAHTSHKQTCEHVRRLLQGLIPSLRPVVASLTICPAALETRPTRLQETLIHELLHGLGMPMNYEVMLFEDIFEEQGMACTLAHMTFSVSTSHAGCPGLYAWIWYLLVMPLCFTTHVSSYRRTFYKPGLYCASCTCRVDNSI
jgi:hypothetical protein